MLVARGRDSTWRVVAAIGVAVVITFLITVGPIRGAGASPWSAYRRFLVTPLTSSYSVQEVLLTATPLVLTGLAVAIAFRSGYYNIGAEGQFLARRDRGDAPRHPPFRPSRRRRAAARVARRGGGRAAVGAAARMAQTGRRDRRGRDDVAAEPGCAAPAPGPAQRAVASPDQRVPRLRDVRARVPAAHSVRGPGACRSHGRCRADRRDRRA